MSTINQLIDKHKHRLYRKCYVKRRITDGTLETDWQRIDIRTKDGVDRVITWGECSIEIDSNPSEIGVFDVSSLQMRFVNDDGFFNVDTNNQSFWYGSGYLNRAYSKLKIVVGYYDTDGTEVGEGTVFEGFLDNVEPSGEYDAIVTILSYQSILTRYNIYELQQDNTLDGEMTISAAVDIIMSQTYITNFIPFVASVPGVDATLSGTDENYLVGTFWDVLSKLAFLSNSIIYMVGDTFAFKAREIGATSVWDFQGDGTIDPDIYNIVSYEDEGNKSVRVWWKDTSSTIYAKSGDATLLAKYLNQPQDMDLTIVKTDIQKQAILDAYLAAWENPKPNMEFSSKFFINIINPLDKITLDFQTKLYPSGGAFYWSLWTWDDGSYWSEYVGPYSITSGNDWLVTKITKDIDEYVCTIRCEQYVT